jgi:hypothetical protein
VKIKIKTFDKEIVMPINRIHCIICDKKFKPDFTDTRKVFYFGKLVYFSHICPSDRSEFGLCKYCNEFHIYANDLDYDETPICEPADNPDLDVENHLRNNYS